MVPFDVVFQRIAEVIEHKGRRQGTGSQLNFPGRI